MPSYNFAQLSPADFENLTLGLLQSEWGQRLEAFKAGRDQGIDLRYACPTTNNKTVVQCKHYLNSGFARLLMELRQEEYPKIRKLAPDRYVVATSVALSPANKDDIANALHPFIKSTGDIIGQTDLNNLLERHPEVEKSNYKLWLTSHAILERVLHNAEASQTEFAVERIVRKLPLYVQSSAFPRAMDILDKENVVEPGIGKTTLADIILFDYLSRGYAPVVIRSELREGLSLYRKSIPQIFYYDDFLGQTFLRERHGFLLRNEDSALVEFINMIQQSPQAKLLLTTREHILSNAFIASERLRRSPLIENKCLLQIGDYHIIERARILYNHIYFSDLPNDHISALLENKFYERIYSHKNFNPRVIEWLSSYRQIRNVPATDYQDFVIDALNNPQELWTEAFNRQISDSARSLVLALFSLGGNAHPIRLDVAWKAICLKRSRKYNLPVPIEGFNGALKEVEGSFLVLKDHKLEFINPSVKDFIEGICYQSEELTDDIIEGATSFDQIFRLWQFAKASKTALVYKKLQSLLPRLEQAVSQVLAMPYEEILTGDSGVTAKRSLDLPPEVRMRALIMLTDDFHSQAMLDLYPRALADIKKRWEQEEPDFKETVATLEAFEATTWNEAGKASESYTILRQQMFDKIKGAYSCFDFIAVDEFIESSECQITDSEQKKIY